MTITAQVTWALVEDSADDNIEAFSPSGTVSVVSTICSIDPSSAEIQPDDGGLVVDYSVDPPTYHGSGVIFWEATWTCPETGTFAAPVAVVFFGGTGGIGGTEAVGTVSSDGSTIEGSATDGANTFTWSFTQ
jgi:hypothetical protein